jgi:hypothetical protein
MNQQTWQKWCDLEGKNSMQMISNSVEDEVLFYVGYLSNQLEFYV